MTARLNTAALAELPADVEKPRYALDGVKVGIVHLGVGAFHRAHQAIYVDDRLAAGETGWGVCGASLRSPDTSDALGPQDHLYTLSTRSAEGERLRIVGALRRTLVAPAAPGALLAAMTDPAVRIVSLTVTEKGYCHDPATGRLDEGHPDIRHDLAHPGEPKSAPGFIVEALRRRGEAGVAPFTVLSCDNLSANGATTRRVLVAYAALRDAGFGRWCEDSLACPSTMVDRIVPATTDDDRARIAARLGCRDAWPVVTEPFSQWVIEDRFPSGRPAWEDCGATLVKDVRPYEIAKLRLLNASHSTLAYLGYLAGYETVADAMSDPNMEALVAGLMEHETGPTLDAAALGDLGPYRRRLIERFKNPALKHRTWQIAMDGSQKLPQRLLAAVRERLAKNAPIPRLALGVAAWMRYVAGVDEAGRPIDVRDPLSGKLRTLADGAGLSAAPLARALAGVREVFGTDLAGDPRFMAPVEHALGSLIANGSRHTIEAYARLSAGP